MAPLHILGACAFALMAAFPVASALAAAGGNQAASAGDATGSSQRMDSGSALVQLDTADQGVVKTFNKGVITSDPNVIGSGRENLLAAVESQLAIDPVSVSFGAVPSGSGQSKTFALTLTNLSAAKLDLELSVSSASGAGVSYSVTPTASVAAGGSTVVVVTMSAEKGAGFRDHNAVLSIRSGGAAIAHAGVYTLIK